MKTIFACMIFVFNLNGIFGQTLNMDSIFAPRLSGEMFYLKAGTEGNQFFSDDWLSGDVKLYTGQWVHNKLLKYNAYTDELIWIQRVSFRQVQLEKSFVEAFDLKRSNGDTVHFKKIRAKLASFADSTDIFVEVLYEANASLYVFRNVTERGSVTKVKDGKTYSLGWLYPSPIYLIKLPDRKVVNFKRIRRHILLKALPVAYKAPVKKLIKQNHLSLRTENDLVNLEKLIN